MKSNQAICILNFSNKKSKGVIYFENKQIHVLLRGIPLTYGNLKGLHIHECGDLSDGCTSACAHYNPDGNHHGGLDDGERHPGDLGNVKIDANGNSILTIKSPGLALSDIIGRSVVLHEAEDDLGKGNKRYVADRAEIEKCLGEKNLPMICDKIMGKHHMLSKELSKYIKSKSYNVSSEDISRFVKQKIEESKKTGNSGKRIACGVIGICHPKTAEQLLQYLNK
jgi:Cu/Zn superoxide dismutase